MAASRVDPLLATLLRWVERLGGLASDPLGLLSTAMPRRPSGAAEARRALPVVPALRAQPPRQAGSAPPRSPSP